MAHIVGGAIGGAIAGGLYGTTGGPVGIGAGIVIGAFAGAAMAIAVESMMPDQQGPGAPHLQELELPTASEGVLVFDLLGTTKMSGNIIQYFGNRKEEITQEIESSKGVSGDDVIVGYRFYLSWVMGFCLGPVDMLYSIYANDQLVYEGELACPDSGGEETIALGQLATDFEDADAGYTESNFITGYDFPYLWVQGDLLDKLNDYNNAQFTSGNVLVYWSEDLQAFSEVVGISFNEITHVTKLTLTADLNTQVIGNVVIAGQQAVTTINFDYSQATDDNPGSMGNLSFYFGTGDQVANATVGDYVMSGLNVPYRGLCYGFFNDCYIGKYNRCPHIKIVMRKSPTASFGSGEVIGTYDHNPAHAVHHIFTDPFHAALPEEFLHSGSFISAADTLATESRGVSILFSGQRTAKSYIQTVLDHVGGVVTYSSGLDLKDEPGND